MAIQEKDFENKLVDFDGDKYTMVVLASMWAKVLKRKQEYKNEPDATVIKIALDDILSGKVTKDMVLKGSTDALAQQKREEEEARKEAERKAKEPLKL
jgi:DNA-directed RNA polymerase subunit K/omega